MVCDPGVAVITPPPQVVLAFGEGATNTELFALVPGKSSVSVTSISGEAFIFCNVIVNVEIPFAATVSGEKALLMDRSVRISTVRFAVRLLAGVLF